MNTFKPSGTELAKVLFTGNNDYSRIHYYAGVYIVELTKAVGSYISHVALESLVGGLAGIYPTLRNKNVRYLLDDDVLIVLDVEDANLVILKDEHYSQYDDMDLGIMVNSDTLKDIDFEKLKDYTPTTASDEVQVRIGGSQRPVDYTNFTICHSKKYDMHTVTIQGGIVIDFMTLS